MTMRVGRYELEAAQHRPSQWGASHRAIDLQSDGPVEITRLADAPAALRTVVAFSRIAHRNVLRVLDVVEDDGALWVVTEHFEGTPLWPNTQMPPARAHLVLRDVLRGLAAIHAHDLVHGQLSPTTVIIAETAEGEVPKLVDFQVGPVELDAASAPEQRDGGAIGAWTDVYRFGALASALLGETPPEITSCLALDPAARPRDARQIRLPPPGRELAPVVVGTAPPRWTTADATEAQLFEVLRDHPEDRSARLVYADHLEQRGELARAAYVREPRNRPVGTPMWRAVLAADAVHRCARLGLHCPARWAELAPTADDHVRTCADCARPVYYVTSIADARARGTRGDAIVLDGELDVQEAGGAYDRASSERSMGEPDGA
jgi:uncharacterized protein (TIGR02996 family)